MMRLTFILLLLGTLMLPTFSAQGTSKCCLKYRSAKVHRSFLKSYYLQGSPSCAIPAVLFTTHAGKRLCTNPSSVWTKTSMAYLDGKNWQRNTLK
uniref:Chemokine interleukin-8-like domain-containing protein n=1 Tax=Fundulus heteroclitus TaxID=8078 RepID=A0A3Q2UN65_FUNHE